MLACYFFQADVTLGFIKTKTSIRTTRRFDKNIITELKNQTI